MPEPGEEKLGRRKCRLRENARQACAEECEAAGRGKGEVTMRVYCIHILAQFLEICSQLRLFIIYAGVTGRISGDFGFNTGRELVKSLNNRRSYQMCGVIWYNWAKLMFLT